MSTVGGTAILTSNLNQVKTRPKTIAARPKGPVSLFNMQIYYHYKFYILKQYCACSSPIVKRLHFIVNQGQRSGIVIPVGSGPVHPSSSNIHQNIQIKPLSKPTIHIKQEGG